MRHDWCRSYHPTVSKMEEIGDPVEVEATAGVDGSRSARVKALPRRRSCVAEVL